MPASQINGVIRHLRSVLGDGAEVTDERLLEDYISHRDRAAFAALVQRHGPMVWGVCRRVLGNHHDAEDAFQATFLVLVRRAASIASRELLANWLYGVAHQTALKARAIAARRKGRERQVNDMPEPAETRQDQWRDLQSLLDEEVSRLPDHYRGVIVLCDLEGKTRKEAAGQLHCAEGTVASRLTRARAMLARRLTQRGVTLSGNALAALLAHQAAAASVPSSVVASTIEAASLFAAGQAATGAVSVKVAALTQGVITTMLVNKLASAFAVVLILGLVATGATLLTCRTAGGQDEKKATAQKPAEPAAKQEKGKATTDEEKLQGEWQAVAVEHMGEKATAELSKKFSIVVKGDVIVLTGPGSMQENKAKFRIDSRKSPKQIDITELDGPLKGKSIAAIYSLDREMFWICWPDAGKAPDQRPEEFKTNKENGRFFLKLRRKTAAEKPVKPAAKQEKEKEAFTAWGKEVDGVQAGLGFRPGEHRAYHVGETVELVVRVRNVGKKEVKVSYFNEFFWENPPTVTDGNGKPVTLEGVFLSGLPVLVQVNLAPGKEVKLCELHFTLRPASEKGKERPVWKLFGTGKFQLNFETLSGNIETPTFKFGPILKKACHRQVGT
jgi:RNA polymerase sigma factor (sigma-70 family)